MIARAKRGNSKSERCPTFQQGAPKKWKTFPLPCWNGSTETSASCPSAPTPAHTTCGSARSCCSRPGSRRHCPTTNAFSPLCRTFPALAACGEEKLHKLWEGLGYYSRVRNLQKAARIVCEEYGGELPADYDALRALPGIGDYTAGAVASISFGIPVPAVDGNVLRVFSRLSNDPAAVTEPAVKKRSPPE